MKKILKGTLLIVLLPIFLISCEQMFTYSMFEWAQRDPSNLSEAQQISYAKSVLGSGDQQAMADAYEAIKDNTDPEVQLLASKLAVGASGINEAVQQALEDLESGSTSSLETYLGTIDSDMLNNAVTSMASATNDSNTASEVTSEEYLTVAAASLISAVDNNKVIDFPTAITDLDDPALTADKNGTWDQQTLYYLDQSGYTTDDLDSMLNYS
ncbi:MAG: hypothetical protein K9M94_14875 [Spirochaetia bacterium]|nr:hypothetical protein [Spirochaetia bacterium]